MLAFAATNDSTQNNSAVSYNWSLYRFADIVGERFCKRIYGYYQSGSVNLIDQDELLTLLQIGLEKH